MKTCLKCGYQRVTTDAAPLGECPKCGAIYAKVEAAIAQKQRRQSEVLIGTNLPEKAVAAVNGPANVIQPKKLGLIPKAALGLLGLGLIFAVVLPTLRAPANQDVRAMQAPVAAESSARRRIEADIAKTRTEGLRPEVLADQERFANNALSALDCVDGSASCSTFELERRLKGLPEGWVDRALGPPSSEQRLSTGSHFYYWTVRLNDDGRQKTCKLQMEYSGVGECRPGVNGGAGACKFNFYC
ncbi:hypothetical protein [Variovorax sp. KK3]|uniref:hypothetical protein n=1 Tax=Variovorax sp. KK3 TaxID=1855728 RepID=UPI00097C5682|nr:hypothetical protein [Variovorax sp. KK3]